MKKFVTFSIGNFKFKYFLHFPNASLDTLVKNLKGKLKEKGFAFILIPGNNLKTIGDIYLKNNLKC